MKKYLLIVAILISGIISAQNIAPKHEVVGNLIKSTYYYENGKVSQEGFFKKGKLHGTWVSFDENGTKNAIAEYNNGKKTGKWFFWNNNNLTEVDYSENRVASVKTWKEDAIVNRN
ncbi:MAG: membrane-binding protein [Flavobacterium sp.]|nr:membrane-binding protein [Flavobacterium sp.]